MHIVIDGRLISCFHGVGKYTIALVTGIKKYSSHTVTILYNKDEQKILEILDANWIKVKSSPFSLKEQFEIPKILKNLNYDLFHVPFFTAPFFVDKLVLTIHDLIPVKFVNEFGMLKYLYFRYYVKLLVNRAKKVLTDSLHSKQDIVEFFNIKESKVEAVYLYNIDIEQSEKSTILDITIPSPYFIYVGNKKGYKNFEIALQSIQILNKKGKKAHLVLVGGFDQCDSEDVTVFSSITSQDLFYLYSNATALIYPSLYEGFGLPILEAMEAGTPVIAANKSSIPEVVGDAGILIEPTTEQFVDAMNLLLENIHLRKNLKEKGKEQLKLFTEEKFIRQTLEVYDNCKKTRGTSIESSNCS